MDAESARATGSIVSGEGDGVNALMLSHNTMNMTYVVHAMLSRTCIHVRTVHRHTGCHVVLRGNDRAAPRCRNHHFQ